MNKIQCPKCGEIFTIDDATYMAIAGQIKDKEFNKNVEARVAEKLHAMELQNEAEKQEETAKHQKQVLELMNKINSMESEFSGRHAKALLELTKTKLEKEQELAVIRGEYERQLKEKDSQIDYYKDLKTKLSTKMVGESLEVYCANKFNELRPMAFPNAYFEKDNDVVEGSKADFIFKDYTDDGIEYISIIFEMKNENDTTKNKHKNTDFLAELDKDRRSKKIEYAVLVSMLEADNDYYNAGIVDVSHIYDKMFVVRPQNFMALISLLRNAAKQTIVDKKALAEAKEKNVDVIALENAIMNVQEGFDKNMDKAENHFLDAIKAIDESIEKLQRTRECIVKSQNQIGYAYDKIKGMTMRKLLNNSPSLKEEYKARKKNDVEVE